MSDLDEFLTLVGSEVPVYRLCPDCEEICIIDHGTYDKPKTQCDPGYCPYWVPICLCKDGDIIYDWESLEECTYPNCECGRDK
jgi:hypothetical protein